MYSLNLPLIRLRAFSQCVGDGGLTGRVTVFGGNGDDAFLFWATCSTGTSMVTGGSTGAVGGRVDPDFDDRGVDVWVGFEPHFISALTTFGMYFTQTIYRYIDDYIITSKTLS